MAATASSRFRRGRKLGAGGMGVVYEAKDEELGTTVALKTIRLGTPESLARLKREFRALQDVHHPNLVSLGELVTEGEECFFTMEFIDGVDFIEHVSAAKESGVSPITPDDRPIDASTRRIRRVRLAEQSSPDALRYHDDLRLRQALVQLAEGLGALHAKGMVHRDIKPANVLVAKGGRVVLLDFGLVVDAGSDESTADEIVGTPEYMAPEQAASSSVGPEADWYSVGVMLYEALTGRVPFEGSTLDVLQRKQKELPPPPITLVEGVPPDLNQLAVDLLHFDPAKRPTAKGMLELLGARTPGAPSAPHTLHVTFVGRAGELDTLDRAFRDSKNGAVVLLVKGESGVGKTALVRRFVERLALDEHRLLVLAGRCYEREAVAYKALDGVVDALARVLSRMSSAEAGSYLPTRIEPLLQVFPVLRRIGEVAELVREVRPDSAQMDQVELRSRAFGALREMLSRIAVRRALLITIDDLQWADSDSIALLTDVFRMPDAPPLLLMATVRTGSTTDATARFRDALSRMGTELREVEVSRLPSEQARELASVLLERAAPEKSKGFASAIAEEAEGHPLFIDALVRHAMTEGDRAPGTIRLEDALWSRVQSLEPAARDVIELLAVAGRPLSQDVLAKAADADRGAFAENVALLRVAHLVTITGARGRDSIDTYHDKVRAAVLARLDDEAKERRHRKLAVALETAEMRDLEALHTHWHGAKDPARAAKYAEEAADRAVLTLAFDHAATLYEAAIDLGAPAGDARRNLHEKLGDALANAGRGERAAVAYERASEGANAARALDLKRRAADQLLRTGKFDAGLDAIAGVLASIGMRVPKTPVGALLSFLLWRFVLWVRGLEYRERDSSLIEPHRLTRIDVCFSVATGLSCTDTIRGRAFSVRALLLALGAGERYRVVLTLSMEIPYVATGGQRSRARAEALMLRGDQLARSIESPRAMGQIALTSGVARYLLGDFQQGLELLDRGSEILTTSCTGVNWELDTVQFFTLNCLVYLGELAEMCRRAPAYLRNATERGDVYGAVNLRIGLANIAWLVRDDPQGSRDEIRDAMSAWSKRGFHLEHFYELSAVTNTDLYAGDAVAAYDRVGARWSALRRSMLLRIQLVRIAAWGYRARSALACAELGGVEATERLKEAEADARRLEGERTRWAGPMATLLRAGVAALRTSRSDPRVVTLLRDAERGFESSGMKLYLAATRLQLGRALGGDEGRALAKGAEVWLRNETVKAPERLVAMLTPGLADRAK